MATVRGLTTASALECLCEDIEKTIVKLDKEKTYIKNRWYSGLLCKDIWKDALFTNKSLFLFHWTSLMGLMLEAIALFTTYFVLPVDSHRSLVFEAFVLFLLAIFNVSLTYLDTMLRHKEMSTRARWILKYLQECKDKCVWKSEHYSHIHCPQSPSITLQPTIRDGAIVNLPWALLVQKDVIILRPGQPAPGRCRGLEDSTIVLEANEVYAPPLTEDTESFSAPRLRKPLPCVYCVLEETPYVNSLKIVLTEALNRPANVFNKEKRLIFSICLEQIGTVTFLIIVVSLNLIRYLYSYSWLSSGHWAEMFLLQPCAIVLPLLPLVLPCVWLLINAFGVAWILALFYTARQYKVSNDPFEEAEMTSPTHSSLWVKCSEMRTYFIDTLFGRGKSPFRTENLLQTLASVTALCCIDKKGILSWPNPTAEKVFFLRNPAHSTSLPVETGSISSFEHSAVSSQCNEVFESKQENRKRKRSKREFSGGESLAEVLDLSHDYSTPFRLQFDDPSWQQYLDSLKPLGLAILLNTCNPMTQEKYAQFCAHLSCLGLFHEDLVPVTNRRDLDEAQADNSPIDSCPTSIANNFTIQTHGCLCELAKQIGFQSGARNIFSLKEQLFTFRHQADLARKDRLARSLSLPKLKFPFPHMVGVCVQESTGGGLQLLSQGTGEIVLDACVDYWDGVDLCPLSVADRKRILDFYNRSSLTAYCTAFAYRPLTSRLQNNTNKNINNDAFSVCGTYLELPANSTHLYQPQRSPTPQWESAHGSIHSHSQVPSHGNLFHTSSGGFLSRSTDSLLGDSPEEDTESADGIFHLQCNQTFVAMVTMQYQARTDMVQLIEQLDKACIRFVHFSKENELRSRVFSEKMGLESGWNCHISLLNDKSEDGDKKRHKSVISLSGKDKDDVELSKRSVFHTLEHCRPLSVSAPSAINVEVTQVKFEEEISLHSLTNDSDSEDTNVEEDRLLHSPLTMNISKTPSPQRHGLSCSSNDCSLDSSSNSSVLLHVGEGVEGGSSVWEGNLSRSQSHVTESTEQSAPVAFDLSNRAKLPRGIEGIRPHIENVDNVPLLVSLFTDCTPEATREMVKIMQDYGEVVCIVGSSASAHNTSIFMQADASLAVEPLYPQVCQQVPVCTPVDSHVPSPMELSRRLNSLPCALSFHRDELPSLLHLVLESRHVGFCLRNMLQLWAASVVSLSIIQLGATLLFLPSILTIGQVLWISCITIPLLSTSLIGAPTDPTVMSIATGKNSRILDRETVSFVVWSYGFKFLPSVFVLLLIYFFTLLEFCSKVTPECIPSESCQWVYPSNNNTLSTGLWSGWGEAPHHHFLYKIQHSIAFAFVLYLVFISMSFIHRKYHFWQMNPFKNRLWITICVVVILLQAFYFSVAVYFFQDTDSKRICQMDPLSILDFPLFFWLVFLWPLLLVAFNELIKYYEIKLNVRLQKRARLEFGTKLGMNSPF